MAYVDLSSQRIQSGIIDIYAVDTPAHDCKATKVHELKDSTHHFTVCLSPAFHTSPLFGTMIGGGVFCAQTEANTDASRT